MASELQSKNVELGSVRKGIKKVSRIVSPYYTCPKHACAKACFSMNPTAEIVAYALSHDSTKNTLKIKHFLA